MLGGNANKSLICPVAGSICKIPGPAPPLSQPGPVNASDSVIAVSSLPIGGMPTPGFAATRSTVRVTRCIAGSNSTSHCDPAVRYNFPPNAASPWMEPLVVNPVAADHRSRVRVKLPKLLALRH